MPALAAPTTARRSLRRVDWDHLSTSQRMTASSGFGRLGCDEGVIEDPATTPVTDPGERQWISRLIAEALHMELRDGEEIAQCYRCLAVVAGDEAVRDSGDNYLFCSDDHLSLWESEEDAPPARLAA